MARRSTMIKTQKKLKYAIRQRNRCKVCYRGRSFLRKFNLCRICFRNLALGGYLPGVGKASW